MSDRSMNGGSVSKRKESSSYRSPTSKHSRKRARTTNGFVNTPRNVESDGESDGGNTVKVAAKPANALTVVRKRYEQERLEHARTVEELNAKLEASERKTAEYRTKYKHGMKDNVEKNTASADKRVADTEKKIKDLRQKHKEDIVAIREELVLAAKDEVKPTARKTNSAEQAYEDADTALKHLNALDPEQHKSLVEDQRVCIKLLAQLDRAHVTIARLQEGTVLTQNEATKECAEAMEMLETDLRNAAEDMRTNSTLSNQKKTLTKKVLVALKEAEPVFMAHAQLNQAKAKAKPETPKLTTPVIDSSVLMRKNNQLQATVNDLQFKLKDVRGKLEEEVQMRQKAEAVAEGESKEGGEASTIGE